jgi:hypothetical protein
MSHCLLLDGSHCGPGDPDRILLAQLEYMVELEAPWVQEPFQPALEADIVHWSELYLISRLIITDEMRTDMQLWAMRQTVGYYERIPWRYGHEGSPRAFMDALLTSNPDLRPVYERAVQIVRRAIEPYRLESEASFHRQLQAARHRFATDYWRVPAVAYEDREEDYLGLRQCSGMGRAA